MTYFWRLLYLFLKYTVITSFIDPGYSLSRDPADPRNNKAMIWHVVTQVMTTAVLLRFDGVYALATILALEALLLIFCTLLERRVSVTRALKAYVFAEILMLLGYGVIVYLTSLPR